MKKGIFLKSIPHVGLAVCEFAAAVGLLRLCVDIGGTAEGDPLFGWAMISPLAILPFALCVLAWRFPRERTAFRKVYCLAKIAQIAGGTAHLSSRIWYAAPQKADFLEMAFVAANFFPVFAVFLREMQNANNSDR